MIKVKYLKRNLEQHIDLDKIVSIAYEKDEDGKATRVLLYTSPKEYFDIMGKDVTGFDKVSKDIEAYKKNK